MRGFRLQKLYLIMLAGIVSMSLVGCQSSEPQVQHEEKESHHESGDLRETTTGANQLPSFVKELDPQIGQVYQSAAENEQLLKWIPCYCGCGESVNHKSNRDCFIHEVKKNGQIVWDSHGTKCGTCLEIAAESASLKKQGKSTLEIRKYIDEKYKEGFAKPTPTPMPS